MASVVQLRMFIIHGSFSMKKALFLRMQATVHLVKSHLYNEGYSFHKCHEDAISVGQN